MSAVVEALLSEHTSSGRIFSNGWIEAPSTIDVIEPATGELIGRAGVGDAAAVARACSAAANAQAAWAATPAEERAALLERATDVPF